DRDAAAAVGRLAKPTAAASLVDRLVRERPEVVHALLATGAELRRAQEELDAARLKELGVERRQRVTEAVEAVTGLAAARGRPPGPAALDEVAATLTAAVLDDAAAAAVASGRLVRSLPADGLEGAPVGEFVAQPDAPPALAAAPARRGTPAARPHAAPREHEDRVAAAARRDAERAVADAERARDRARRAQQDAEDDLADADRRREEAGGRATELRDRIAELRRRLDAAEDDLRAADRDVRDRRGDERSARRAAEDAEDALARARARLDQLG
ncbi:MAG TPA: hypothetical protein VGO26_08065, partial [Amnibacterium sp.]|nr:hypothetical protein [Amnibacterium sp.]